MTLEKPNRKHNPAGYRLGIVGGGQLAKMTAHTAQALGAEVVILERSDISPALPLAKDYLIGDWDEANNLIALGEKSDIVSLENEFVDANALAELEAAGHQLIPSSKTISLIQDKYIQKQTLAHADIAMPKFIAVSNPEDIIEAAETLSWPLVLKARRNGYDGKGNATIKTKNDIAAAWKKLDGDAGRTLYVEEFCPFKKELAVMVTRARNGEMVTYPVVETIQKDHICHTVIAPANISEELAAKATEFAKQAVVAVDGVGTLGVEMFLSEHDEILLNEMAPRVHNSGHYSIEACECSQFENHVRALFNWPLGSTKMRSHFAVMVNLLGNQNGSGFPSGIEQALQLPGVHVHSYGKLESKVGRKMGHITVIGDELESVLNKAKTAADLIKFGAE